MRIKNRRVIRRLSDKSFRAAKLRNGIAMLAIALTAILFTALFTVTLGVVESFQYITSRQAGGDAHGSFKYLSQKEYETLKKHPLIKTLSYNRIVSDSVDNKEFLKRHVEMYQMDEAGREISFIHLSENEVPKKADDIAMDTKSLDLLGVPHKAGQKITLTMTVNGKLVTRDFTLCGFWESDPLLDVGFGLVSPAYCAAYKEELSQVDYEKPENAMVCGSGSINAYVYFFNTINLQEKLDRVIEESGYSTDEDSDKYIASNANWAYLSTNFGGDPASTGAVAGVLLLIMFTGYLIIYNVFQISIIRDIRFYGLLKTIGTTKKQIRAMILRQAVQLSLGGIPVGLVVGFLIGKTIVPKIMAVSSYRIEDGKVTLNPAIFIGAALFTVVTVLISTRKPGKIASSVSPVEAVRYTEGGGYKKRAKDMSWHVVTPDSPAHGGFLFRGKHTSQKKKAAKAALRRGHAPWRTICSMARANLGRNKKKTALVFCSLSLSVILLNSVFTISQGFDMDKYLSNFVDTDFLIGNAAYFAVDNKYFGGEEGALSESFIKAVKDQPGFIDGGTWHMTCLGIEGFDFSGSEYGEDEYGYTVNKYGMSFHINTDEEKRPLTQVYGADDFCLGRLALIDAKIGKKELKEKLDSGDYILEGVSVDENGRTEIEYKTYEIGDKVTIANSETGKKHTFEVLAHVESRMYINTNRVLNTFPFYTSEKGFEILGSPKERMSYAYECEEAFQKPMADFLKNYTENVEPDMGYETKFDKEGQFQQFKILFVGVGAMLSLIIGLIGALNFINSVLTGIITRKREFAMMMSIGMTKSQLLGLVVAEGIYYAMGSVLAAFAGGILVSRFAVKELLSTFWFFTYKMILWPMAIAGLLLLFLGVGVPWLSMKFAGRESLVERLRQTE